MACYPEDTKKYGSVTKRLAELKNLRLTVRDQNALSIFISVAGQIKYFFLIFTLVELFITRHPTSGPLFKVKCRHSINRIVDLITYCYLQNINSKSQHFCLL